MLDVKANARGYEQQPMRLAFQILLILFGTFCDDSYCLFFSHNWNPYIYGILANLKGRFLCRSR